MNVADEFKALYKKLIVSCQAEGDSPFNSPEGVTRFAIAALKKRVTPSGELKGESPSA